MTREEFNKYRNIFADALKIQDRICDLEKVIQDIGFNVSLVENNAHAFSFGNSVVLSPHTIDIIRNVVLHDIQQQKLKLEREFEDINLGV